MSGPLRIGLIGCGRVVERFYLPAFERLGDQAAIVAAADPRAERCHSLLQPLSPGCRMFTAAEQALQQDDLQAVIIATPPETHRPIACAALRAGLPVLVEKPLALCSAEARDLEQAAGASQAGLMVGFNQRHWEPVQRLHKVLREQARPEEISLELCMTTDSRSWSAVTGVPGPLEDLGSHLFDLARFLSGSEIVGVQAREASDDSVEIQVRLSNGAAARCRVAHGETTEESIHVRSGGREYRVRMGSERIEPADGASRFLWDFSDAVQRRLLRRRSSLYYSYERQLRRFLQSVRAGGAFVPNVTDGAAAVYAVEAAQRSLAANAKEISA